MHETLEKAYTAGNPAECEVLIVGGSLVGLSAAAFLGWHRISPLVVEKHAGTSIHPRAGYFHVGTMEAFRAIGLDEAVRKESERQFDPDGGINAVESLAGREISRHIDNINEGLEPYSPCRRFFMTQQSLEPLIRQRAEELGARLSYSTELAGFEQDADGVLATVRDLASGQTAQIRARYMIAADGNRSPVRHALGIRMAGPGLLSESLTIYFRADCGPWIEGRNLGVIYVVNPDLRGFFRMESSGKRGFLAVNTLGDLSLPDAANVARDASEERCIQLVRSAVGVPDLEIEIEDIASWRAVAETAGSFRKGRVFIAGDAAHVMPPTGGFGGNTGVQDAYNLAWKLAMVLKGKAAKKLLASYDAERRPVAANTVAQAHARYIKRVVPEQEQPGLPELVDEFSLELGQLYRSDIIASEADTPDGACEHPDSARGRPGTRAPHVPLIRDGKAISSIDFAASGFALLAGPEGQAWCEAGRQAAQELKFDLHVERIGGEEGARFAEAFGIGPSGASLVRPDGFVAWRAREDGAASAETLGKALGRAACLVAES